MRSPVLAVHTCIHHGRTGSEYGHAKSGGEWAHRRVYREAWGLTAEDIAGKVVRHTCDNGWCIEPTHLLLGTHQDNVRDRVARDRTPRGESHCCAKLTRAQVGEIRRRYKPRCRNNGTRALGREFGVHQYTVSEIVRGVTWRNL